jgi:hypothetical protein
MSYMIKENNGLFDIYEKNTEILIKENLDKKSARDLCRKLNLGSGFNGWTPMFFLEKYDILEEA